MCLFKRKKWAPVVQPIEGKPQKDVYSYFSSESCGFGHPDILSDAIADGVKDFIIKNDPLAHVAIEVMVTTQYVLLAGEVTTSIEKVPYIKIVKDVMRRAGYTKLNKGFDVKNVRIYSRIHEQSKDIAAGTNESVMGAGDQGIINGFACNETPTYIPLSWKMARDLTTRCHAMSKKYPEILCPDCKSQVTVRYKNDRVDGIETIVIAASHEEMKHSELVEFVKGVVIEPVLEEYDLSLEDVKNIYINGTGNFVIYGPDSDTGLTGRKLICNQYGGHSAIGGGSMQGKDSTKVDFAAALMARYIAKNIVAAGLADKCQVQLGYCIGRPQPVSININCFGTEKISTSELEDTVWHKLDCTPTGIINKFNLRFQEGQTFYHEDCSACGWFGRDDVDLPWEKIDPTLFVI